MAIFRYEKAIVVRSPKGPDGKPTGARVSTLAKSAYIARERLRDEQTREVFNFAHKRAEILAKGIALPDNAPAWMGDRQELWNAIERAEKRKDSQLANLYILTLPRELPLEQQEAEMQRWAKERTDKGFVVDWGIHKATAKDGGEQPHGHALVTTRPVDPKAPEGFGPKPSTAGKFNGRAAVGLGAKAELVAERHGWAGQMNRALEACGSSARVDARSLKERGINREPQPKMGPAAAAMERKGQRTRSGDAYQVAKAVNASLAWEDAENDDSAAGRKRRKDRDGFHARRIARGAAIASRDALHDATPGMERGTSTTKEAVDRAAHTSTWQERERARQRERELEPER